MRAVSKTFSILTTLVTVLIVVVAGAVFLPRLFGIDSYIVTSGSMEPAISTGALAFVATREPDPSVGDVIAYDIGDGTVVRHRVEGTSGQGYITKGDANESADLSPVSPSQVLGTYLLQIPEAGYLLSAYESRPVSIGNIQFPAAALIIIGGLIALYLIEFFLSESVKNRAREKE